MTKYFLRIFLLFYFFLVFDAGVKPNVIHDLRKYENKDEVNASGNNQFVNSSESVPLPLKVQVVDSTGRPVSGVKVLFFLLTSPNKAQNQQIGQPVVLTDNNGFAQTGFTCGDAAGVYEILAKAENCPGDYEVFTVTARKSNWVMLLIFGLLGGLAMFLYGMFLMSEGLQKSAGSKMRTILSKLTYNRVIAIGVGTFVTMVIQSSSATTVMLISFVQSGLMTFTQTLGIILGADIGTTFTTQLIAFKLTDYALLFIAIGFLFYAFSKNDKISTIGQSVLGFGILFFGMFVMGEAMEPLKTYEPFLSTLIKLDNPLLGILFGTLFTALVQSSGAFIGIVIVLSSQGFISLEAGIPLILGSNIGTAITAILASINTGLEAKKVAIAHTLFKILGVLLFAWWIPYLAELVVYITPGNNSSAVIPHQLANAHTVFNIAMTVLALPFINFFGRMIDKMFPKKPEKKNQPVENVNLDASMLQTPALALNLAKQETLRMAEIVNHMTGNILCPFIDRKESHIKEIEEQERQVNFLRDEINAYLIRISQENIPKEQASETFQIMFSVKELEHIADIVSTNMLNKAKSWIKNDYQFSDEGKNELIAYHTLALKQLKRSIEVLRDVNLTKAEALKKKFKEFANFGLELEKHHYERLMKQVDKTISSSKTHMELLEMLRLIGEHSTNLGRILLKWSPEKIS